MPKVTTKRVAKCQICSTNEFKYTCSTCRVIYCSVACYKQHKETCDATPKGFHEQAKSPEITRPSTPSPSPPGIKDPNPDHVPPPDPKPLRPLTSLKWPYIPDEPAHRDPLKRDDPKTLQMHHYEALATDTTIRKILGENESLQRLLREIDALRGAERERALQRALGVSAGDLRDFDVVREGEDVVALRKLGEAVEACVRGKGGDVALGLDWDAME